MSDGFPAGVGEDVWRSQAHFNHCVDTSTKLDHLNSTGGIAISFAPQGVGAIHLAFSGSQSKSLSIWETRSKHGFLSIPKFRNELYTIRFVKSGSMIRNNGEGSELEGHAGRATLLAFDDMIEDRASAEFSALSATVTRKAILLACEALEGNRPQPVPHFIPVVDASSPNMLGLRQVLYTLHSRLQKGVQDSDFIFPLIEEIIVYQIISIWPKFDTPFQNPAVALSKSIRVAIDYIEANLGQKITIAEIASACGIGVRALQISFRRDLGCTPFQFIIDRRLEQVHRALQSDTQRMTIRQIAMQWGFANMSDFGRRYKQRYGCSPTVSRNTS